MADAQHPFAAQVPRPVPFHVTYLQNADPDHVPPEEENKRRMCKEMNRQDEIQLLRALGASATLEQYNHAARVQASCEGRATIQDLITAINQNTARLEGVLERNQDALVAKITELETKITNLETKITNMDTRITNMDSRTTALDTKIIEAA